MRLQLSKVETLAAVAVVAGITIGLYAAADNPGRTDKSEQSRNKIPGKWERHYYDRVEQFRAENKRARNIILLGSSHFEGFDAARWLPGRRVVNRGIASDRIGITDRGILRRLECSVFDCNPGVVVIQNGVNDLGELWRHGTPSIPEIEACYRKVVRTIRERRPDVPVIIVGLFPTRGRFAELRPMILDLDARLETIAEDHRCTFIKVLDAFADDQGRLKAELTRDGLHMNEAGYRIWAGMLRKALPPPPLATLESASPAEKGPAQ